MDKNIVIAWYLLTFVSMVNCGPVKSDLPVEKFSLYVPPLSELAKVLEEGLLNNYRNVKVTVVNCPDLTQFPFYLAAQGLGGSPRLVNLGSASNLFPVPKDVFYDMDSVANAVNLPGAFILGAGQVPRQNLGGFGELIVNAVTGSDALPLGRNGSVATMTEKPDCNIEYIEVQDNRNLAAYTTMFFSEGRESQVLAITAKVRTGTLGLEAAIRTVLNETYGPEKNVGLGGAYLIYNSTVNSLILEKTMWKEPAVTAQDRKNLHCYYNLTSPMVCPSFIVSNQPYPDMRTEHSHCINHEARVGGHYTLDSNPDTVEYVAYLIPAEDEYIVDRPANQSSEKL